MALAQRKVGYHDKVRGGNGYEVWDEEEDDYRWVDEEVEVSTWRVSDNLRGKYIGVELELEADGSWERIRDAMPEHRDGDGPAPDFEEDGSLSEYSGVEIIFPPIHPETLRDPGSYFHRAVSAIHIAKVTDISYNCGMHMNVNTWKWSRRKKAIFCSMIHNMPQRVLEHIGGRGLNGYCHQLSKQFNQMMWYASSPGDSHSWACEDKGNRFECRFPGATTDMKHIARISYFLEYLEDFAEYYDVDKYEELFCGSFNGMYEEFLAWLGNKRTKGAKDLCAFIAKA